MPKPSNQSSTRSVLRWLAHYRPQQVVIETDSGEEHTLIVDQKSTKKWNGIYQNMMTLNACNARLLDAKGAVLSSMVIREVERSDERQMFEHAPATTQGVDIAAIIQTTAKTIVDAVTVTMNAMAQAHQTSFSELVKLSQQSNERAATLEREHVRDINERAERLAEREDEHEEERERIEAEREREREENSSLKELITPLLSAAAATAGPQLVDAIMNGKKSAAPVPAPAPKVDVKVTPVVPKA